MYFGLVKSFRLLKPVVMLNPKRHMMKNSINHIMNKKVFDRYLRLPTPCNKIVATYIWIDGSGINLRSKARTLNVAPSSVDTVPKWAFDGSSTGQATTDSSDTVLQPVAIYKDPFKCCPHILVLCEVYIGGDKKPAPTNHRKFCNDLCEAHANEQPWFGIEQEYTMLDTDGAGLGWPKGGFPAISYQYSYCGMGAKYIAGRDICESHEKACLYAGIDYEGNNAEVMHCSWEWQVGLSHGIKGPDDLWCSRYIMARVAEDYGVDITYHPKPMGAAHPGIGMHHNISTKKMRTAPGGFKFIEECIKKLETNHMKHMKRYGNDEATNRMRLTGKHETAPFDKFSWGLANRKASIRLQRNIKEKDNGFIEDRRPAGDCDPYLVCGLLMETCLGPACPGQQAPMCPKPKC